MPNPLVRRRVITRPAQFRTPTLIAASGSGTGGALTFATSLIGDLIIGINSSADLSIATQPAGCTAIDTGVTSDESGNDCAIIGSAKFTTADGEGVGAAAAGGGSRSVFAVFRGVDPRFLTDLTTNDYAYRNTSGTNNWGPPAIPWMKRPGVVLAFGRRGGTSDTLFTNLTQIHLQNTASSPAQLYWTAGEVPSFADDVAYTITAASARASLSVFLPGARI
jgi:hypothetical protein